MYENPVKIKFAILIQAETEVLNIYTTAVNVKFIQSPSVACERDLKQGGGRRERERERENLTSTVRN